jgi:hypothetical protein
MKFDLNSKDYHLEYYSLSDATRVIILMRRTCFLILKVLNKSLSSLNKKFEFNSIDIKGKVLTQKFYQILKNEFYKNFSHKNSFK